jgi:hypothetical protein
MTLKMALKDPIARFSGFEIFPQYIYIIAIWHLSIIAHLTKKKKNRKREDKAAKVKR